MTRQLTLRLPDEEHEALRIYAFLTKTSVNETVTRAVRQFLATNGRNEEFEAALDRFRREYRIALDKLADL